MHHLPYILAAYSISALVLGGLIAWSIVNYNHQRRALRELKARGARRRSDSAKVAE